MRDLIRLFWSIDPGQQHFGSFDAHFIAVDMNGSQVRLNDLGFRAVVKPADDNIAGNGMAEILQ
ncbi:hypothetical protein D3C80_1810470 [compost metagenome]